MNWKIDIESRTATHATGLVVRFGERGRDGAIDGTAIAGLDKVNPADAARLMREAGEAFSAAIKNPRNRFIHHITVTTGHTRKSYRNEVGDDVVLVCADLIARAIKGRVEIPGTNGYTISADTSRKRSLLCVVRAPAGERIVTFAIARHSQGGASLWRLLIETASLPVVALDCPPEPWCAVRLEQGAMSHAHVLPIIADLERCIAWAWLGKE